eukprot:1732359-Rhodomonas_salina.1
MLWNDAFSPVPVLRLRSGVLYQYYDEGRVAIPGPLKQNRGGVYQVVANLEQLCNGREENLIPPHRLVLWERKHFDLLCSWAKHVSILAKSGSTADSTARSCSIAV